MASEEQRDANRRRQYLLESFEEEDTRWQKSAQVRDWLILLGLVLVNSAWMLIAYLSEPGLRGGDPVF